MSELRAVIPQPLAEPQGVGKLTANNHPEECPNAVDGKADSRYSTGADQKPGQWFQIEFPQETLVSGLELDTTKSPNDYPRGLHRGAVERWQSLERAGGRGPRRRPRDRHRFHPGSGAKFIRLTQTGSA